MEITGLDFLLINFISYVVGVTTGIIICCKNKDKLLVKSRSLENISRQQYNPPVVASAPPATAIPIQTGNNPPQVTKITLE